MHFALSPRPETGQDAVGTGNFDLPRTPPRWANFIDMKAPIRLSFQLDVFGKEQGLVMASDSATGFIKRNRPPRVQIAYADPYDAQ